MVKVNFIITTYNNHHFLNECLLSLNALNKKNTDVSIYIVDDGSGLDCVSYLKSLQIIDPNINLILRSKNSGRPSEPRNDALEKMEICDYVCFLDPDDILPINYLMNALFLLNKGDVQICSAFNRSFTKYSDKLIHEFDNKKIKYFTVSKHIQRYANYFSLSGLIVSYDLAILSRFENIYLEDWLYIKSLYKLGGRGCVFLYPLILYRSTLNSLSPNKFTTKVKRFYKLFRREEGAVKSSISFFLCVALYLNKKIYENYLRRFIC